MKRTLLVITLLLLGLGLYTYPYIAGYFSEKNSSKIINNYDQSVSNKNASFLEEEKLKAREYNDGLVGKTVKDPFVENTGIVMDPNYTKLLNVDGVMGYIRIPKIRVNLSIYHGTSEDSLQKGVGHLEGSSLPVGGLRYT